MLICILFGVLLVCPSLISLGFAIEKEVFIAGICSVTGPAADVAKPAAVALEDAFNYFNKTGGIEGHKIRYVWDDNRYKVPEGVSIYKKFMAEKPKPIIIDLWDGSGLNEAIKEFMEQDKVPAITVGLSDATIYPAGWIFADSCAYGDQSAAFFNWFKSRWKEKRNIRIAYLSWNSPYGRSGYEEVKKYVAGRGGEVVGIEYTPYTPISVMPQLLKFKELGVDYIWTNTVHPNVDVAMKEMAQAGIKIPIVGNTIISADIQIRLSGVAAEGYIACQPWYSYDYEINLPKDFLELMKEASTTRGQGYRDSIYVRGWHHAYVYREVIRLALKEVGYEKLDGEAVMKYGFMRLKNFKTPFAPNLYGLETEDDRRLSPYVRFTQVKNGKVVPITGSLKAPWLKKELEPK
jgi:branched-chain amino acid transport system substrate-binding protein